jgi:hypothetical protein
VWWLIFNVGWVDGSLMEHLISVNSFLEVVVHAAGVWEIVVFVGGFGA